MRKKRERWQWAVVAGVFAFLLASTAGAVMFFWTDEAGNQRVTHRSEVLSPTSPRLFNFGPNQSVSAEGMTFSPVGGSYDFFSSAGLVREVAQKSGPPPARPGSGPMTLGRPITPAEYQEIKRRYQAMGGEPVPEVVASKVIRIPHPNTFILENGQPASYIGIEYPLELEGNAKFKETVLNYQKRLMLNRTVHLLFGPQRLDAQGRLLTFVFVGTDMFVNADLVMNGYARVKTVPPNVEYEKLFLRLQGYAQQKKLGMWALPGMKP